MTEKYKESCNEALDLLNKLKVTEKEILDYVMHNKKEPIVHSKVAENLGLSYSTVVRALSRLQKLGVVDKVLRESEKKKCYYIPNFAFSRKIYFALKEEINLANSDKID